MISVKVKGDCKIEVPVGIIMYVYVYVSWIETHKFTTTKSDHEATSTMYVSTVEHHRHTTLFIIGK